MPCIENNFEKGQMEVNITPGTTIYSKLNVSSWKILNNLEYTKEEMRMRYFNAYCFPLE